MERQPTDKFFRIYLFNATVCSIIIFALLRNRDTLLSVLSTAAFVLLQLCIYDGLKRERIWAKYAATAVAVLSLMVWAIPAVMLGAIVAIVISGFDVHSISDSTLNSSMTICVLIFITIGAFVNGVWL